MSTTTLPTNVRLIANAAKAGHRAAAPSVELVREPQTEKPAPFFHFLGDAFAAWASAGRQPH